MDGLLLVMEMVKYNSNKQFVLRKWATWPPIAAQNANDLDNLQNNLLSAVPGSVKRRLSPLAKTVFCAFFHCNGINWKSPVVFSSTHGELGKSLEMIKLIEAGEEISPTAFSLSVHNAIAGLISIVCGNTSEITVLAPGEEGIAPAFVEALGLLAEGAPDVLLIFYDEPLPDFYPREPFKLSTDRCSAVVLQISQTGQGEAIQFSRDNHTGYVGEQALQLPLLIDFLTGNRAQLNINTPRQSWHWQRLDEQLIN